MERGVWLYDDVRTCPECGASLDPDLRLRLKDERTSRHTVCLGPEHHRWHVLGLHQDRSGMRLYRLAGPEQPEAAE